MIILIAVFGYVGLASAALVPCGQDLQHLCTTCDFFKLFDNVKNFLMFKIIPPVGVLFVVIAGFFILTAGGKPANVATGQKILTDLAWGLLIIFGAWMITNTALKLLTSKTDISSNWYTIQCNATSGIGFGGGGGGGGNPPPVKPPVQPPGPGPGAVNCSNPQSLAQKYSEPYRQQNAPELTQLISCIRAKLPGVNLGSQASFDQSHPLCNYTRGNEVCGSCSHRLNSCHYGGHTGSQGALAVDFGNNETAGDQIIQAALSCGAKNARCEDAHQTRPCNGGATHVHVTAKSCDAN